MARPGAPLEGGGGLQGRTAGSWLRLQPPRPSSGRGSAAAKEDEADTKLLRRLLRPGSRSLPAPRRGRRQRALPRGRSRSRAGGRGGVRRAVWAGPKGRGGAAAGREVTCRTEGGRVGGAEPALSQTLLSSACPTRDAAVMGGVLVGADLEFPVLNSLLATLPLASMLQTFVRDCIEFYNLTFKVTVSLPPESQGYPKSRGKALSKEGVSKKLHVCNSGSQQKPYEQTAYSKWFNEETLIKILFTK
ncbi:uncharacterized protein LOC120583790 [Pteropus medius]|uniref:uncharacterized protein LOC120583790 n=1 Tax=Pteropus vampyrus TaxID=132908 RepID=UPI00196B3AA9|nr:uncharacterized protein LOC120583790 [Pteropus giganteus]